MKSKELLIGVFGMLIAVCSAHAQLIQNGGFESGTFADWNVAGTVQVESGSPGSAFVQSGNYGATLGSGRLFQTFLTTPGTVYRVEFRLNAILYTWPGPVEARWENFSVPPGLDLGYVSLFDSTAILGLGWYNYSYDVLALGNVSTLEFEFQTQSAFYPNNAALDEVSVSELGGSFPLPPFVGVPIGDPSPLLPSSTPYLLASSITRTSAVPEPSTYGLMATLGLGALALRRRARLLWRV